MENVDEALLGKVVRGELLDAAPVEEPEIDGHLEEARCDSLGGRLRPRMLGRASALADVAQVIMELLRANSERAGVIRRKEPVEEKIAQQEFVARDMPEKERFPDFHATAVLRKDDQGAIPTIGVEPTVQYPCDVAQPGGAARTDDVLFANSREIFARRAREVPRCEHCIGFVDHGALHNGE